MISLPENLLAAVDHEASAYYMRRSQLVRWALIYYLQPTKPCRCNGKAEDIATSVESGDKAAELYTDPEELFKILRHQKLRAGIDEMLKQAGQRKWSGGPYTRG